MGFRDLFFGAAVTMDLLDDDRHRGLDASDDDDREDSDRYDRDDPDDDDPGW